MTASPFKYKGDGKESVPRARTGMNMAFFSQAMMERAIVKQGA